MKINRSFRQAVLIITAVTCGAFSSKPGPAEEIVLQDDHFSLASARFYVADVVDDRADKKAVAYLVPTSRQNSSAPAVAVDLHGGALNAVKQFIESNLPVNTTLLPVVMHIKKFTVAENVKDGNLVEGHVVLNVSFYTAKGNDDPQHLVDYSGNAAYTRSPGPPQDIEPSLRHMLENSAIYLNKWITKQAGVNIKLAKAVKVKVSDYVDRNDKDTIYYEVDRPLTWDDFRSRTANSRFDAEVFPEIGYSERAEVVNGILALNLAVKVSMPRSACWVRDGSRNDYTLNHEQRHFDIAKLVAEHFKQEVQVFTLPVSNYDADINMQYLESYRELDNLEKQYDAETHHGTDEHEQQRWNEHIDKELKMYGVKK